MSNYRKIFSIVLFLVWLFFGVTAGVKADSLGESLFWRVSTENAKVYLLGSIHLANDDIYPFPLEIEEAFEESDYLAVEVDITNIDQNEMVQLIQQYGRFDGEKTLREVIPDSTYEAVKDEFEQHGLNIRQYEPMKPWVVALTLSQLQMAKFGYIPEYGVDLYFLSDARDEKEIIELETGAEQLRIFSDLDIELQILLLEDFLYDLTMPRDRIHDLFDAYARFDAEWIKDFVFESVEKHPELELLYEELLHERNRRMAEKIDSFLRGEGTYFVVVGAAHLFGETGIPNLLWQKGYEPVKP